MECLVSDDVREIVPGIVITVLLLHTITVECVVVEPAVPDQPVPLVPPRRYMVTCVLVQVLACSRSMHYTEAVCVLLKRYPTILPKYAVS